MNQVDVGCFVKWTPRVESDVQVWKFNDIKYLQIAVPDEDFEHVSFISSFNL